MPGSSIVVGANVYVAVFQGNDQLVFGLMDVRFENTDDAAQLGVKFLAGR